MYEFRRTTLQEAVHNALGYQILSTKKLAKASVKFDFATRMRLGSVLFVGEGNLSFALTVARKSRTPASSILATVYEAEKDLTDTAYENAQKLLKIGCQVKTSVDATWLSDTIGNRRFQTIIFQFPNVASRDPRYGQNPNHVLVTRFLKSARDHLKYGGLVVISTVDSSFYEGAFKMDEAARKSGFAAPAIHTFVPNDYPGYIHQNTANEESAADGYTAFATFVFSG
ncbi:Rossmann-like fold-containing protein [Planktotalea arctica]|uniref:Rossmann-like fold-containing protein n=1 Tax=Planktotalea arctica TaxID=1481893 RepID=UPI000A1754AB|nr:Rossmann-like fold-containing protein [Planktotalea arctica]